MKKVYQLIGSVVLALSTVGAFAQTKNMAVVHPHVGGMTIIKGHSRQPSKTNALTPVTVLLNYDSADATIFNPNYYHNQAAVMNTKYKFPTDTTGSGVKGALWQNYTCIDYAQVAFDSLYDPYAFATIPAKSVASLTLDTIYVPYVAVNYSGHSDTLEIQVNSVSPHGVPTSSVLRDTMIVSNALGIPNYTIAEVAWGLNYKLPKGSKFAVTLKYYDYTKADTCWFIYGFGYFMGGCPGGSYSLADPTNFSPLTGGNYPANSFLYWSQFSAVNPDSLGDPVFYDCNGNGSFDLGTDGATYMQNVNVYVMATADTGTAGINDISSRGFSVGQNYPNPFNKTTEISYSLTKEASVVFTVCDMTGRELVNNTYNTVTPGQHVISLQASQFTPGIYFYTFNVNGTKVTRKMVITQQ